MIKKCVKKSDLLVKLELKSDVYRPKMQSISMKLATWAGISLYRLPIIYRRGASLQLNRQPINSKTML
jgi:hypothetical protein